LERVNRVYTDTSVIGGCFDREFEEWSCRLFDLFRKGEMKLVISDITINELEEAPGEVKDVILSVPEEFIERVNYDEEADILANRYIRTGIVEERIIVDAQHVAIATVVVADFLVSWNFKHIVNFEKIRKFNGVNMIYGYRTIDIRTPREVVYD